MSVPAGIENERLLELFFAQSLDGFFFMMIDEPVEWGDHVNKDEVLDYIFEHQRMTKVNSAIITQFNSQIRAMMGSAKVTPTKVRPPASDRTGDE